MINLPRIHEFTVWATGRCNLRCKYCFVYRLYENQPKKDFDLDLIEPLIDFGLKYGVKPFGIWWFGGEPLVAWDVIVEAVKVSEERGLSISNYGQPVGRSGDIRFGLTTNLVGLDEKKVEFLSKYRFGILCSIDGVQDKHDRYRVYPSGKGSWKDAWRGLQLVRKHLVSQPQIRWTYAPATLEGLAEDLKWYVKQGLTNIAVDPAYETRWTEEDYTLLRKEMLKIRDYAIEWFRNGIPVFLKPIRDGIAPLMWRFRGWEGRCGLGMGSVGVDIDGTIYPCHRFVSSRTIKIGHITEGFYPKRYEWINEWRKHPPYSEDPDLCIKCPFRVACIGGCLAVNYDLFGDPHICPIAHCRIHNILAETFMPLHRLMIAEGNEFYKRTYLRGTPVRE